MAVFDQNVERAWRTLESRASRVDFLRAVAVVAGSIQDRDDEPYLRLQGLIRSHDATVIRAIESALLQARRRGAASRPSPFALNEMRVRLRAPDPMDRLVAVQECLQGEFFGGVSLIADRLRVETDSMALVVLARALGLLGGEAYLSLLEELSGHESAVVRAGVVAGLRYQESDGALRLLLRHLADEDEQVRHLAHEGLTSCNPDHLVSVLRALPATSTPPWLRSALEVLSPWRHDPEVSDLLGRFEAWDDEDVAERAEELREDSRPCREEESSWA